ncbi:MAG TPA: flagellar hook-basal body complex protein [Candidatus Paceibacterota bacterium]|nr:flagellar hook-basal body complex protein [Candidatus Paceibacterota bacterium]
MSNRSLGAAASGISTMQTYLDTIANNVANSQTNGYVSQTIQFSDLLTEQLQPAGGAVGNTLASTNPSAIGSGVEVAAIRMNFAPGSVIQTGVPSNVAVEGNGLLTVSQQGQTFYTLNGDLQLDANGHLATNSGGLVMGWTPGQPTSAPLTPVSIQLGSTGPATQTQNVVLTGNLPSNPAGPATITTTIYDSLGSPVPVTLTFTPTVDANGNATSWAMNGTVTGAAANLWAADKILVFSSSGQLSTVNGTAVGTTQTSLAIDNNPSNYTWSGATKPAIDFPPVGSTMAVTQFASSQSLMVTSQDGNAAGTLNSYSIGSNGVITGAYSNGGSKALGTVALARFANIEGLANMGQTYFTSTVASGIAQYGQPGSNGFATLQGGAVIGSNVDLATELTHLIQAQTAYQANTKVIATTDSTLQSLMRMP